ncbi:Cytochrome P450 monooxygenase [Pseudocercospora fuligena]|uniref:Cytochrome P450 monooxygenase n=1 Tax=Pseudocercospora fuligena TaxID=685502 RepID=A0A8H6RD58_9PEZI|nr:Cytochrome P450 monooxygenase [Pseudocercospora fuligena]
MSSRIFSELLLVSFVGLVAAFYIASWVRSYQRLSHIPGPTGWGLTVIPWVLVHLKPDMMDQYHQLSKKYGPLVRVGPNTVITSDADVIRKMSAVQSPYRRSMNYYAMRLNPGKDHVFSTRDEAVHNNLRKTMTAGYSGKENLSLENDVDESILELCQLIDNRYLSTAGNIKPMDLARKIGFMVLDVVSKVAFDAKFYDLRDDRDNHGYIAEIENLLPSITWIAPVPGFVKFLTDIGLLQMAAKFADGRAGVEKVKRIAHEQVEKRFQLDGRPKDEMRSDMLGSFIRHGLSRERAKEEAVLNLTAGSDTTASTIRATMLNIMTSPRLCRLLTAEIDDAVARGALPPEGQVVSEDQARQLPLLQATIKEGLRWYPAVAAELSKLTPPQGDAICGYYVPGGTKVGTSMKALHRNEELYGPDAEAFRPERWLLSSEAATKLPEYLAPWNLSGPLTHPLGHETDPAKLLAMLRNNDLVFGNGRFQCLGKPVAWLELNKIFVELLRRYEFSLINVLKPWDARCCGTHLQKDMWVTVRRRD